MRPALSLAGPRLGSFVASAPLQLSGEGGVNLSQASLSLQPHPHRHSWEGPFTDREEAKRRVETRVLSCLLLHCLFWAWVSKVESALVCKATRYPLMS